MTIFFGIESIRRTQKTMARISLCMIVRDEEANLPRSLAPIASYFDEVVVIDTGSTDGTRSLAQQYGAKVFDLAWKDDFAYARNESIARASGDWILWFDADNQMTPKHAAKIRGLIDTEQNKVFWLTEVVEPRGERLIQKRIFPNLPQFRFVGRIHEQLTHPSEGVRYIMTDIEIHHWGYVDKELLRQKGLRNLRILLEILEENPEDFFAHFNIARCFENFRQFAKAQIHLRKVLQNPAARKENPDIYFYAFIMMYLLYEKTGSLQEGRGILESLLKENPDFGLGWFYSGKLYFKTGNFALAAIHLERFHRLGISIHSLDLPRQRIYFESYYWLGQCYEKLGEPRKARQAYENALGYDPQNSHIFLRLALLCKRQGEEEAERGFLRRCLELHPQNRTAREALRINT